MTLLPTNKLWQLPFVNVFRLVSFNQWKRSEREGDVTEILDKAIGKTSYRILGSVPAANWVAIPKSKQETLGLTGRYAYIELRNVPKKPFVFHVDVVTTCGNIVRISVGNMYSEDKASGTSVKLSLRSMNGKWTVLVLDLPQIVSRTTNFQFKELKSLQFCANVILRNVFTSHNQYEIKTLPRDMSLPVFGGHEWIDLYDWKSLPMNSVPSGSENVPRPELVDGAVADSMESSYMSKPSTVVVKNQRPKSAGPLKPNNTTETTMDSADTDSAVKNTIKQELFNVVDSLIAPHEPATRFGSGGAAGVGVLDKSGGGLRGTPTLQPDPIMDLQRIIGQTGRFHHNLVWSADCNHVVFSSNTVIVIMNVHTCEQRFLTGHTEAVSVLALDPSGAYLASTQEGKLPLVRVWEFETGRCLSVLSGHTSDVSCLAFSGDASRFCAVGCDEQRRQTIVVWDITRLRRGQKGVVAKIISDYEIKKITFLPFDPSRLVSCGKENIRMWRIKNSILRACSVVLEEHSKNVFTDLAFDTSTVLDNGIKVPTKVYVSSMSGQLFQIAYPTRVLECIYQLHSGPVLAVKINEGFCVTGSADKYLRVWPLDFTDYFLECEHDSAITSLDVSSDGMRVAVSTANGSLGSLDISTHKYKTIVRSHTGEIFGLAMDPHNREMCTTASDGTTRVWDLDSFEQLYQFDAPGECSRCVAYHPTHYVVACGYDSGHLRVFDIATTTMIEDYRQHNSRVVEVLFTPDGRRLFTAAEDGSVCVYDVTRGYQPIKTLNGNFPGGRVHIAMRQDGELLATIGTDASCLLVFDAKTLKEKYRIKMIGCSPNRLAFSPNMKEIIVTTLDQKMHRFDLESGQANVTTTGVHRAECTSTDVSRDCRYIVSSGNDKMLRVWDYNNCSITPAPNQAFIGHPGNVNRVLFTPDNRNVVSVGAGDAVYVWKFLGAIEGQLDAASTSENVGVVKTGAGGQEMFIPRADLQDSKPAEVQEPEVSLPLKHYNNTHVAAKTAQARFVAPSGSAALQINRMIGYNGLAHNNVIWHPRTALFAYTSGNTVIVEDLETHSQKHLVGHEEEISVMALSNNGKILASAAGTSESTKSALICLWDTTSSSLMRALSYHETGVQALSFSSDDRFLISVGDYRERAVVVWDVKNDIIVASSQLSAPIYDVRWDPMASGEFVTVGHETVTFWLLTEELELKCFEAEMPPEESAKTHFTAVTYGNDGTILIGNSSGDVSLWNTSNNQMRSVFHAFEGEIDCIVVVEGYTVIVGGQSPVLTKFEIDPSTWKPVLDKEAKMLELDGATVAMSFDANGNEGLVGTSVGTIWYVNWSENSLVRLVNSHTDTIPAAAFSGDDSVFVTASSDRTLRVWTTDTYQQLMLFQFHKEGEGCTTTAFMKEQKKCASGHADGTVRLLDVQNVTVETKCKPHDEMVTAMQYMDRGQVIMTGASDGVIAISSTASGATSGFIRDHLGSSIEVLTSSPIDENLWLAASADGRISTWMCNWVKGDCNLINWLPLEENRASNAANVGCVRACFSPTEGSVVLATGVTDKTEIVFYDFYDRLYLRSLSLNQPARAMSVAPNGAYIMVGTEDRLVKFIDYEDGTFQDFLGHSDSVECVHFSNDGNYALSTSYADVIVWKVMV